MLAYSRDAIEKSRDPEITRVEWDAGVNTILQTGLVPTNGICVRADSALHRLTREVLACAT